MWRWLRASTLRVSASAGNQVEPRASVLMSIDFGIGTLFVWMQKGQIVMTPAKEFEAYFDDPDIPEQHLAQLQRVRQFVHEIYPDITERVAYAMPGFYPVEGKKATETLLFVMAQKNWLGIYALPEFNVTYQDFLTAEHLQMGKGSIQVPYDYPADKLRTLVGKIMLYNLKRFHFNVPATTLQFA